MKQERNFRTIQRPRDPPVSLTTAFLLSSAVHAQHRLIPRQHNNAPAYSLVEKPIAQRLLSFSHCLKLAVDLQDQSFPPLFVVVSQWEEATWEQQYRII
ncbi:hypothetical protein EJB05_13235, partial [Eragrostis curvula]